MSNEFVERAKVTKWGCTEGDAVDLLPLAKSWLRAPRMKCGEVEVPYDVEQRAHVLSDEAGKSQLLRLHASPEQPVNGIHVGPAGSRLVLWIPLSATAPINIDILR